MSQSHIEVALVFPVEIIFGADHHQNLAGFRVYGHDAVVGGVEFFFVFFGVFGGYLLGFFLQRIIYRRNDFQSALLHDVFAVFFFQIRPNVDGEVGSFDGVLAFVQENNFFFIGRLGFFGGDKAKPGHFAQNQVFSFDQFFLVIAVRGVVSGGFGQTGQISGFGQTDVGSVFAEKVPTGRLNAVVASAVGDGVQIQFQDFVFGN